MARSVRVVGAGVIGLTTAVTLAEVGHQVTVVADETPGRTSLAAGASWGPYQSEPRERVGLWGTYTMEALIELSSVPGAGVRMVTGIEASRKAAAIPDWARRLPDVKPCGTDELPPGFRAGWHYTVPVVDMPRYLDYLIDRLRMAGGRIERQHVAGVCELVGGAGVVVNCSGLGARALVADDSIYPIRGQLVVVGNPGIDSFFSEDTGSSALLTHYLPQGDKVILGGVAVPGDWNREPDRVITEEIVGRCAEIEPLLNDAYILEQRVGLRPTRPQIRLEAEASADGLLIHNYGHGGAGVSLSWGCADEVRELIPSM